MNFFTLIFKQKVQAKQAIILILTGSIFILLGGGILVYCIDPFQIFHKTYLSRALFSENQRYQTAGLINSYPAKSYIVGTSMTENFNAQEASQTLGWSNVQRLSISGLLPKNFSVVLSYLLKKRMPQNIVMDAHWYFESLDSEKENQQFDFPVYLYNDSDLDDFKYIFNHDSLKIVYKLLIGKTKGFQENLETLNRWMNEDLFLKYNSRSNKLLLREKLAGNHNKIDIELLLKTGINYRYPSFDKNILPLLKRYSRVKFHIFLPPYSTWYYATNNNSKFNHRLLYMRKYLADSLKKFKNVTVYGFDLEKNIVNDLRNYKDYGHFRESINRRILQAIGKQTNIIHAEESSEYLERMILNINNYQLLLD